MFTCWRNSLSGRKVPAAVLAGGRARVCCFVAVLGCRWRGCRSSWRVSLGWFCCRAWLRLTRGCSGPGPQFGLRECGRGPMRAGPLNLHVRRGSQLRRRLGPLPPPTPQVTRGQRPQVCSLVGVSLWAAALSRRRFWPVVARRFAVLWRFCVAGRAVVGHHGEYHSVGSAVGRGSA